MVRVHSGSIGESMGVETEFIVAHSSDANAVLAASVPSEVFPGFDAKGVDSVMVATLRSLLTGAPCDEQWAEHPPVLAEGGPDGPWVHPLPDDMVVALARLSSDERRRASSEWARTEELSDWPPDEVASIVDGLAEAARRATAERKALMMWVAL